MVLNYRSGYWLVIWWLALQPVLNLQAQMPEPTDSQALLVLTITNMADKPRPREIIQITGSQLSTPVKGVTDTEGKFSVLLPKGGEYIIHYKVLNEWKTSEAIEVPDEAGAFTLNLTIGFDYNIKRATLRNLQFDSGKSSIRPESFDELDELAEVLKIRKQLRIAIEGHTDNVGDAASNMELSQKRSEAVKAYLITKGIEANRIEARGLGETIPVASNETAEGRQQNRRTEAVVISGYDD